MPFCANCGSQVQGQFCPSCGTPAPGAAPPPPPPPAYQQQPAAAPPPPVYQQPVAAPPPPAYQQPAAAQPPPAYQQQAAPPPPPPYGYQQPGAPPPQPPYGYQQPYQQPGAPPAGTGLTDNVAGALCYFPSVGFIISIVFLAIAPYNTNKQIRFHAFQSLFLHVVWAVAWIALGIVSSILFSTLLTFGWTFWRLWSLVYYVVHLAFLGLCVILMLKAYQNHKMVLPVVGQFADKQA